MLLLAVPNIMGYGIIRLMPVLLIAAANHQRGYLLALHVPPDKVLITTNKLAVGELYKENPDMTTGAEKRRRRRKKISSGDMQGTGPCFRGVLAKEGHAKDETGLVIWLIAVWPHGRGVYARFGALSCPSLTGWSISWFAIRYVDTYVCKYLVWCVG